MSDPLTFQTWPWALIAIPTLWFFLWAASRYMAVKLNELLADPAETEIDAPVIVLDDDESWEPAWSRGWTDYTSSYDDRLLEDAQVAWLESIPVLGSDPS